MRLCSYGRNTSYCRVNPSHLPRRTALDLSQLHSGAVLKRPTKDRLAGRWTGVLNGRDGWRRRTFPCSKRLEQQQQDKQSVDRTGSKQMRGHQRMRYTERWRAATRQQCTHSSLCLFVCNKLSPLSSFPCLSSLLTLNASAMFCEPCSRKLQLSRLQPMQPPSRFSLSISLDNDTAKKARGDRYRRSGTRALGRRSVLPCVRLGVRCREGE